MALKKLHEKYQKAIKDLQKLGMNKVCADCGEKLPQYINLTHATFVCMVCSGVHREFSHRIKGISLSEFSSEEVEIMKHGGNDLDRETFMARYNSSEIQIPHPGDTQQIRIFIRAKYEEKRWIASSNTRNNNLNHSKPRAGSVERPKRDPTPQEKPKRYSSSVPRDKSVPEPREKQEKTQLPSIDLIDIFSTPQPEINFGSNQQTRFHDNTQQFPQQQSQGSDWVNFSTSQPKVSSFETQNFNNFSNPFGGFDNINNKNAFQTNFKNTTINNLPNSGFTETGSANRASIAPFTNTNGSQISKEQPNPFQNAQFQSVSNQNQMTDVFEELIIQEKQEKLRQQQQQSILYGGSHQQQQLQQQIPNNFVHSVSSFGVPSYPETNIPQSNAHNWGHPMPGYQQFLGPVPPVQHYQQHQQQYYSQSQFYQTSASSPFDELLQSSSQPTGNVNNQKQQQQKSQLFTEFALNQLPRSSIIAPSTARPVGSNSVNPVEQKIPPQQSSGNPFDDLF